MLKICCSNRVVCVTEEESMREGFLGLRIVAYSLLAFSALLALTLVL